MLPCSLWLQQTYCCLGTPSFPWWWGAFCTSPGQDTHPAWPILTSLVAQTVQLVLTFSYTLHTDKLDKRLWSPLPTDHEGSSNPQQKCFEKPLLLDNYIFMSWVHTTLFQKLYQYWLSKMVQTQEKGVVFSLVAWWYLHIACTGYH